MSAKRTDRDGLDRGGRVSNQDVEGRPLPCSPDIERFVLGSILLDDSLYHQAASVLSQDDFSEERHRKIFRRMGSLSERLERIDRVTIVNELIKYNESDSCGGLSYLVSLDDGLPQIPNIDSYIRIIKDKSRIRRIFYSAQNTMNRCLLAEDQPQEIIEAASTQLLEISGGSTVDAKSPSEIVHEYPGGINEFLDPSRRSPGTPTGYIRLDEMTGGLRPGELFILGGRPSSGKSSLARNIAQYITLRRHGRVVIFSLEMSKESVLQAMACAVARTDLQRFRMGYLNPDERRRVMSAMSDLMDSQLLIDETAALTLPDFRARVRKIQNRHGPISLVEVDYLQLMTGRAENRNLEIGGITRGMKVTAKELGVPIMVLSQLSRAVDQRKGDHRPQLSDLRESGSIEQDADLVGFIFREEVYHRDREDLRGVAELILAKQRAGPTGTIDLVWIANQTKFENRDYTVYDEDRAV